MHVQTVLAFVAACLHQVVLANLVLPVPLGVMVERTVHALHPQNQTLILVLLAHKSTEHQDLGKRHNIILSYNKLKSGSVIHKNEKFHFKHKILFPLTKKSTNHAQPGYNKSLHLT
jgi:hypothetical protein